MSSQPDPYQLLFGTEADQNPNFALTTSIVPNTEESEESIRAALSSQNWVVLSGDKGQGKTSYLYLGIRELPKNLIGVYCPFGSEGSKFEVIDSATRDEFLCKQFYSRLISRLEKTIQERSPKKTKECRRYLENMSNSLIPVSLEQITKIDKEKGFWAKIGIKGKYGDLGGGFGRSTSDETIRRRNEKARPDYEKFRDILIHLIELLGFDGIVFFVDEVNEITLSRSEQAALFDHLYLAYKVHKSKICFKVAITDKVELPTEIIGGNYFEPINLKSFLLHPREYEDFVREIFIARIKALKLDNKSSDFFSDSALHVLAMASMGNPRDFFLLARQAWQTNHSRIELPLTNERIKRLGGEREAEVLKKGGPVEKIYYSIVESLKQRSNVKAGPDSPTGVSYFLISNFDKLESEVREMIAALETAKILYSTGSFRALRRSGQKSEMMVISYPICALKSIRFLDVVKSMIDLGLTEGQIISQHRAQIEIIS